jgi:TRAP-type mannitol/chloroaromatic compound transport system permease small subunit
MHPSLVELWQGLQGGLPPLIAYSVLSLILLLLAATVLLPALMLLWHEPAEVAAWIRERRAELRQRRRLGAGATELALRRTLALLEGVNVAVGQVCAWLALSMALMQFVVVVMRYVFAYGSIQMQESIWYLHGLLFMLGVGYALLKDAHVRVDIFYAAATPRRRALIDLLGSIVFVLPLCAYTWWLSWSYVSNSWAVKEGSTEGSGLPYVYLLKTVILAFLLLLAIQAVATIIRSTLVLADFEREDLKRAGTEA